MIYAKEILSIYAKLTKLAFPENWRKYRKRYEHSKKGQLTRKKHTQGAAFKATQKRYLQSEKGKTTKQKLARQPHIKQYRKEFWSSSYGKSLKRASSVAYKARKRNAAIGDIKLCAKIYARARELRQWFSVAVDHIIPLAKGGAHSPENLQIIYAAENLRKHDSLNYKPKVIFI